jgi:hypothetical protein
MQDFKRRMVSDISAQLAQLGVQATYGNGADIVIDATFVDAKWSTGKKQVRFEASVLIDEARSTVFMWQKTGELSRGFSFGVSGESYYQNGKNLYRKVKALQYAPDGKAYEYELDLGAVTRMVEEVARHYGYKFNTVVSRGKASYGNNGSPSFTASQADSAPVFCTACGQPVVGLFCGNCGAKVESSGIPVASSVPVNNSQTPLYPQPQFEVAGGLPPGVKSLLFWGLWGLLAVLSVIMVIADFSVLRFILLAVLLIVPFVTRKALFRKIPHSFISWAAVFVVFFIVVAISGSVEPAPADTAELLDTQTQNGVSVSLLEGMLADGETISVQKNSTQSLASEDVTAVSYDITLPAGADMEAVAEIRIPIDKSLIKSGLETEDALAAGYFDSATNTWEPIPYLIDSDNNEVIIYTNHFSSYGVLYFKDGRKSLTETIPYFDSMYTMSLSIDELNKVVNDIAGGADKSTTALDKGWNQFCSNYNLTNASYTVLDGAIGTGVLSGLEDLMNNVGTGLAFAQIAYNIYQGDTNSAVNNLVKNTAFSLATAWGGRAVNLASAGATFIDYSLTSFAEAALDANMQKWESAYRNYYKDSKNPDLKRSAWDWYVLVKKMHSESTSTADFQAKLDASLTEYCAKFWNDGEYLAYVAESTPGIVGFSAGGEWGKGVSELSARYKEFLYHTTMKSVLTTLTKNLWSDEYNRYIDNYVLFKNEMNKKYTVTVNLQNYQAAGNLTGTTVSFINSAGQIVHSQSFDSSGRVSLNMTLFSFLKMDRPVMVEVHVPAQGQTPAYSYQTSYKLDGTSVNLNIPYQPVQTTTATTSTTTSTTKTSVTTTSSIKTSVTTTTTEPLTTYTTTEVIQTTTTESYDYEAALAAWVADFTASANRSYDDGACRTTYRLEWVVSPYIDGGEVRGAYQMWRTDSYYAGPRAGETNTWVETIWYDSENPGVLISLSELMAQYPQYQ